MSEPEEKKKREEATTASGAAEEEQFVPLPAVAVAPPTTSRISPRAGSSSKTSVGAPAPGGVTKSAATAGQETIIRSSVPPDAVDKPAAGEATSTSVDGSGAASMASDSSGPSISVKSPPGDRVTKLDVAAKSPYSAASKLLASDDKQKNNENVPLPDGLNEESSLMMPLESQTAKATAGLSAAAVLSDDGDAKQHAVMASVSSQELNSQAMSADSMATSASSSSDEKAQYSDARPLAIPVGESEQKLRPQVPSNPAPGAVAVMVAAAQVSGVPSTEESEKNDPQEVLVSNTAKEESNVDESNPAPASEDPYPPPPELHPGQNYTQPGAIRVGLPQDLDRDNSERTLTYPAGPYSVGPSNSPQTETRQDILVEASLVEEPQAITTTVDDSIQPMSRMPLVQAEAVPEPGCYRPRNILIAVAILLVVVVGGVAGAVVATGGGGSDDGDRALFTLFPTASPVEGTPTQSPSASPSTVPSAAPSAFALESFQEMFLPEYSQVALASDDSPQTLALSWLGTNADVATISNEKRLQRFALATLYYATDGDIWSQGSRGDGDDGWLSDEDECDWYTKALGATFVCFGGKYQNINIEDNGLSGVLPAELTLLSDLLSIQMGGNGLFGELPAELGILSNLRSIQMDGNELSGFIPTIYGLLTDLRIVSLFDNFLSGPLPAELGLWRKVQSVELQDNVLTGQIPEAAFLGWTGVQDLDISFNLFSGTIPSEIGSISGIIGFGCFENDLRGNIPSEFGLLTRLEFLDISSNDLTGTIPSEIGSISGLIGFGCYENDLRGNIPSEFGLLTRLEILYLDGNMLTGPIPSTLGRLTRLEELDIYSNEITGTVPIELCELVVTNGLILTIDCELVECNCGCVCFEADSTFSPTVSVFPSVADIVPSPLAFLPSDSPTKAPIRQVFRSTSPPTQAPVVAVTDSFTTTPSTIVPTSMPVTEQPTQNPTSLPPTQTPTRRPTKQPIQNPSAVPTKAPTSAPVTAAVFPPSLRPTRRPTKQPTETPTATPTKAPTSAPVTAAPFIRFVFPTRRPTPQPTKNSTAEPTRRPTKQPTKNPTAPPTKAPTLAPVTAAPVIRFTFQPIPRPTRRPTSAPIRPPTNQPTRGPNPAPTQIPTRQPARAPTLSPTRRPSNQPAKAPTRPPTRRPAFSPTPGVNVIDSLVASLPLYSRDALSDPTSPQGQAIQLLADDPQLEDYTSFQVMQRYVLGVFYFSTGGEFWDNDNGWLSALNECEWYSDFSDPCSQDGRYVSLSLIQNGLEGEIPQELELLTALRDIELEENFLSGTIPRLANLVNLEGLFLFDNLLSGEIPSSLGALTSLTALDLDFNVLIGNIPSSLGLLTRLDSLLFADNNLEGTLPTSLQSLRFLETFQVYANSLTGTIPIQYRFLSRLVSVGFEDNFLSGNIPGQVLNSWTAIEDLNLGDNFLFGELPPEVGALVNLDFLDLYGNELSGELPDALGVFRNARKIYLEDNFFSGTIPRSLGFLTNLEVLHLYDNDLSGEVPDELCALAELGLDLAIDCFLIDCPCNACNCDFSSRR